MPQNKIASLLLRSGLASVLLYAGVASFVSPAEWAGYLPQFLTSHFMGNGLIYIFAAGEVLLALWLLSGAYVRYAAALTAVTFTGIVLTNLPAFQAITFRDVPLIFTALALIFVQE